MNLPPKFLAGKRIQEINARLDMLDRLPVLTPELEKEKKALYKEKEALQNRK